MIHFPQYIASFIPLYIRAHTLSLDAFSIYSFDHGPTIPPRLSLHSSVHVLSTPLLGSPAISSILIPRYQPPLTYRMVIRFFAKALDKIFGSTITSRGLLYYRQPTGSHTLLGHLNMTSLIPRC
jgi:hypothetical protein